MKKLIKFIILYLLTIIWGFVGNIVTDNIYAICQRTYTGIYQLYTFIAFWFGLSFLLMLIRSKLSVSMQTKMVLISGAVSLIVSIVLVATTFSYIMLRFYFGGLLYLLLLLTIVTDLFDMVYALVTKKNHQS